MPRGPKGEKRPADSIGCAVNVARIATGEQEDAIMVSPNRRKSGVAGAKARVENLSSDERRRIAKKAAGARWEKKRKDDHMEKQTQQMGTPVQNEPVVHMYPDNQLKDQKRRFEDTQSAFSVVKKEFFNN